VKKLNVFSFTKTLEITKEGIYLAREPRFLKESAAP
jgi:hypothetical protein